MRTHTIDPNEPVVIRVFHATHEAELARALLESEEIACMLLGNTFSELNCVIRLAVRRDQAAAALAALDAPFEEIDEGGDEDADEIS